VKPNGGGKTRGEKKKEERKRDFPPNLAFFLISQNTQKILLFVDTFVAAKRTFISPRSAPTRPLPPPPRLHNIVNVNNNGRRTEEVGILAKEGTRTKTLSIFI
jgi:hypothetical protein